MSDERATDNLSLPSRSGSGRRVVATVVKIALGIGFVVYLIVKIDPSAVVETAADAEMLPLLVAIVLVAVNVALETSIWRSVLIEVGIVRGWRFLLGAVLAGFALGAVTPARVGEFAGRAFYLDREERWKGAFTLALSRQPELSVLGIVGCVGLGAFLGMAPEAPDVLWGVLGLGAVATIFVTAISVRPVLVSPLAAKFGSYVSMFPAAALAADLEGLNLDRTYVLSILRYVVFTGQFYLLAVAFGISIPPFLVLSVITAVFLIRFVVPPITFMDLGIREGASVWLFAMVGAPQAAAFNAAFMVFVINIALPALVGLFALRRLVGQISDKTVRT